MVLDARPRITWFIGLSASFDKYNSSYGIRRAYGNIRFKEIHVNIPIQSHNINYSQIALMIRDKKTSYLFSIYFIFTSN